MTERAVGDQELISNVLQDLGPKRRDVRFIFRHNSPPTDSIIQQNGEYLSRIQTSKTMDLQCIIPRERLFTMSLNPCAVYIWSVLVGVITVLSRIIAFRLQEQGDFKHISRTAVLALLTFPTTMALCK